MMTRRLSVFFLLACLVCLKALAYDGYGISVELLSDQVQKVTAGRSATFTFKATNITDKDMDCVSRVYVPDELGASTPDPLHFYLVSSRYSEQQVTIYVPQKTPKGRYALQYTAESQDNPVISETVDFYIEVRR